MTSVVEKDPSFTTPNTSKEVIVCYSPIMITTNGVWMGDNPLEFSLPLFILQLTLVVVTTYVIGFLLKPFRQPRVISDILGGVLLGPSVFGRNESFADALFPLRSVMVLDTMANMGLLYFLFLVGVEMDLSMIKQTGRRALAIAISGMILPFLVGAGFSFLLHKGDQDLNQGTFILFIGVALAVTTFPVLARILAEVKLINSDIGRIALSSALINDMCAWVLLALAIALAESDGSSVAPLWVLLTTAFFVVVCVYIVRPCVTWMIRRTPEGESFSESHLCVILTGVMVAGFITDAIGIHSIFGAFVFGLVIPNGPLGVALVEKLDDFVSGILLPLFFVVSGLKTDVGSIGGASSWGIVMAVVVLSSAGKIIGTLVVTSIYHMPFREGVALGFLMNTKGLVEMIIINVGKDQKVLNDKTFAIMVVATVIMTVFITPVVTIIYRPSRRSAPYKRTIEKTKPDGELRVLVCIHTPSNVQTIINLLEASNPTKKSPISVSVLHLMELTGRASAMLIVHNTRRAGRPGLNLNRTQAQSDHIINAFESFEQRVGCVAIQPLTVISPYSTMHEDISNLAEDERVALIVLPFHSHRAANLEPANPALRTINRNVLASAPCSVGILVDRGLNGSNRLSHHIALLFFGGRDDREALAYASRMSDNPGISLTVMRFVPGQDTPERSPGRPAAVLTTETESKEEKRLDDEAIGEFRKRASKDESIDYMEKEVSNGTETVGAIRSMNNIHDLIIVGRGCGGASCLTAGLGNWNERPELGTIGHLLASSDFAAHVSILVVQQHVGVEAGGQGDGGIGSPYTPGDVNPFAPSGAQSLQRGENVVNH